MQQNVRHRLGRRAWPPAVWTTPGEADWCPVSPPTGSGAGSAQVPIARRQGPARGAPQRAAPTFPGRPSTLASPGSRQFRGVASEEARPGPGRCRAPTERRTGRPASPDPSVRQPAVGSGLDPATTARFRTPPLVPVLRHEYVRLVPRISAFYGIVIALSLDDHPPPHFHAKCGEHPAQIAIATGEVLNGKLPRRALGLDNNRTGRSTFRVGAWLPKSRRPPPARTRVGRGRGLGVAPTVYDPSRTSTRMCRFAFHQGAGSYQLSTSTR